MHNAADKKTVYADTGCSRSATGNDPVPVIAFSAWSGTGKTTIIEQVIARLKQLGFRVAVIKHDAHDFEIDKEGKDSWRFSKAGADITVINSTNKTALIEQRSLAMSDIISLIHDVDLILVEGYNNENLPKIGISRSSAGKEASHEASNSHRNSGKGFRHPLDRYIAIITDEKFDTSLPAFALDDIEDITGFILSFAGLL